MDSFTINRNRLASALNLVVPFCYKKRYRLYDVTDKNIDSIDDTDIYIDTHRIEQPCFTDKVFIRLISNLYVVSVFNDGLRVQSKFISESNEDEWMWNLCFNGKELRRLVGMTECDSIRFRPIDFWGFALYDNTNRKNIGYIRCVADCEFDIEAYLHKFCDTSILNTFHISKSFIGKTMTALYEYSGNSERVSEWNGCINYIIKEGVCTAYGTQRFMTGIMKSHCDYSIERISFSLPIKFSDSFAEIYNENDNENICIEFHKNYITLNQVSENQKFTIDIPKVEAPDIEYVLDGDIVLEARIQKSILLREIEKSRNMMRCPQYIVLHFFEGNCVFYIEDGIEKTYLCEYQPLINLKGEGTISLIVNILDYILEDVKSEEITIIKKKNTFFLSSDESIDGDRLRVLSDCKYNKDKFLSMLSTIKYNPA